MRLVSRPFPAPPRASFDPSHGMLRSEGCAARRRRGPLLAVLIGLAARGILVPHSAPAAAQERIKLAQPVNSLSMMPLYVARANKYFEAEGIDLEVIVTGGDGPNVQALLAKNVEFAASGPHHLFIAHLEGKPLLGVANILNRCVINLVVQKEVATEHAITESTPLAVKLKSMKGLTIGATRPGAFTYHLATYFVKKAGYEPQRDVKIIGAGAGPTLLAALENRKVDIIVTSTPDPEMAVARGLGIMLINNSAGEDPDLREFLQTVLYVRPGYAHEKPDMVRRMVRAVVRANAWISRQSPEEISKAVQPFFPGIDSRLLAASVSTVQKGVRGDGRPTGAGAEAVQDILLRAGSLRKKVNFSDVFTNLYLPGEDR